MNTPNLKTFTFVGPLGYKHLTHPLYVHDPKLLEETICEVWFPASALEYANTLMNIG